jgi:8-oxo-dGTP pyrophosphatase MutT (NUDIX family)
MDIGEVVKKLELMLRNPLPGRLGQITMAPQPVDEERFVSMIRDDHRKGAVLMLFYPDAGKSFIPFIKRPFYQGVHGGQISLPGGKWEPEDGELSQTALREAEEEIGIDASKVQILGKLSDMYIPPSNFMVSPYIGFVEETPLFNPDPKEVERIINCPFQLLLDKKIRKKTKINASTGKSMDAPYFDIQKEVVWGATAMILGEFTFLWENTEF